MKSFSLDVLCGRIFTQTSAVTNTLHSVLIKQFRVDDSFASDSAEIELECTHVWDGRSGLRSHGVLGRRAIAWLLHSLQNSQEKRERRSFETSETTGRKTNNLEFKYFLIDVNKLSNIYANRANASHGGK